MDASHEDALPRSKPKVGIRIGCEQLFDNSGMPTCACAPQGRCTVVVLNVDVCSRVNQELYRIEIVPKRGPMERRRTIGLSGIDVDALVEQGADSFPILIFSRFHELEIGFGSGQTNGA